jgi:ribosomal protein L37AE/L43A
MKEGFSQLVAGLLGQARKGEDLSSVIKRVRAAIRKEIEGDDTIVGKLKALEGSLREVIPDEKMRCQAAIKTLSTTSKLSREEIVSAVNDQLEELAMLEKLLVSAFPQVITEIKAELASFKEKAGEPRVESAAQQPVPDREIKSIAAQTVSRDSIYQEPASEQKQSDEKGGQKTAPGPTPPPASKKKCRMCAGHMDYYAADRKWQCYSCAHEEPEKNEVQSKDGAISKDSIFPGSSPVAELKPAGEKGEQGKAPEQPGSAMKQKCPLCGGQMAGCAAESKWQCHSCGFENNGDGQGKREEKRESNALFTISLTEQLFDSTSKNSPGYWQPKKKSPFLSKAPATTKTCPVCSRKMQPTGSGKGWQCRNCGYERKI